MSRPSGERRDPHGSEVVSSVDGDGPGSEYVIADITEEDAWIAMQAGDAPELTAWR